MAEAAGSLQCNVVNVIFQLEEPPWSHLYNVVKNNWEMKYCLLQAGSQETSWINWWLAARCSTALFSDIVLSKSSW